MKKISLIVTLLSAVLLLQNCKKDTVTAITNSSHILFAYVDGTSWAGDTIKAVLTYKSATKSKIFSVNAIGNNKQINMAVTQANTTNTPGFPLSSYTADAAGTNVFTYLTAQKNSTGNYSFVQVGSVGPGSGSFVVTAIDSAKQIVTGTFAMTVKQNNYDTSGNIISVSITQISQGEFTKMPYTFVSN